MKKAPKAQDPVTSDNPQPDAEESPEGKPPTAVSRGELARILKHGAGGARPGAGRKAGGHNRVPVYFDLLSDTGVTPLAVLTACYQSVYAMAQKRAKGRVALELLELAFKWALAAAPFVHPRLSTENIAGVPGKPLEFDHRGRITLVEIPDNGRVLVPIPQDKHLIEAAQRTQIQEARAA